MGVSASLFLHKVEHGYLGSKKIAVEAIRRACGVHHP
jgi:hypothetical protein